MSVRSIDAVRSGLVRFMIAATVLGLSACAPAANPPPTLPPPTAAPTLPVAAAPTLAPTSAPSQAPTAAPPQQPAAAPTLAPTTVPPEIAAVPLPTIVTAVWTPAARTKTTGCVSQAGLPDPACTPGAIDIRVTMATTAATICTSGYTATVRPPVALTDRIKTEEMAAYGLQGQPPSGYELDHLISLELGGAPQDVANLWPQPWNGDTNAHQKDAVETHLKRQVCSGAVSLADAQRMIATDWLTVFRDQHLTPAP